MTTKLLAPSKNTGERVGCLCADGGWGCLFLCKIKTVGGFHDDLPCRVFELTSVEPCANFTVRLGRYQHGLVWFACHVADCVLEN